jgi:hypothetical protein
MSAASARHRLSRVHPTHGAAARSSQEAVPLSRAIWRCGRNVARRGASQRRQLRNRVPDRGTDGKDRGTCLGCSLFAGADPSHHRARAAGHRIKNEVSSLGAARADFVDGCASRMGALGPDRCASARGQPSWSRCRAPVSEPGVGRVRIAPRPYVRARRKSCGSGCKNAQRACPCPRLTGQRIKRPAGAGGPFVA